MIKKNLFVLDHDNPDVTNRKLLETDTSLPFYKNLPYTNDWRERSVVQRLGLATIMVIYASPGALHWYYCSYVTGTQSKRWEEQSSSCGSHKTSADPKKKKMLKGLGSAQRVSPFVTVEENMQLCLTEALLSQAMSHIVSSGTLAVWGVYTGVKLFSLSLRSFILYISVFW